MRSLQLTRMYASSQAARHQGYGLTLMGATGLCLSGCTAGGTFAGAETWLAALALLLVGALAYALGVARTRLQSRTAPTHFSAASALGERAALAGLSAAQSPGGHDPQASPDEAVTATAMPTLALQTVLDSMGGAALIALQDAEGLWQVQHANTAARALWPRLVWPASLEDVLTQLPPPAASAALAATQPGTQSSSAAGWHVQRFEASPTQGAGLLLNQQTQGADGGHAAESDNFSFTASHDLRAPIRVVEGFTRIVKEDYGHLLDRVGNDHLDRVLGAAARMNLMIDALLTLARLSQQPLARQPVNLSQLASFIIDDLRRTDPVREADIDIEAELSATGDPTLLRLVLENLLGNAWKYSGNAARAHISLRTLPHAGGIAYVVRDNGAGFDMRSADRLFGLFQRLHSASEFPGHGVGLASVRRIVNRHGGEIWADAEPGRGAAFYFTLGA
jgi:signal transduction histidine kinase